MLDKRKKADGTFDYERQYDARASRGAIPAQTGDFAIYTLGEHGVIEVKEVAHDFRLPKKNFSKEAINRCIARHKVGGAIILIVHHSTTKKWRYVDFEYIRERRDEPSWDLSEFDEHDTPYSAVMTALQRYDFL